MLSDINNSKEAIKNRMLKHALNYWGIKNTEDIDPAVKLILEGLSLELYNLGNEIKDVQVRILEKIAGLLTPDFLTSPNPAHAILHAAPVEPVDLLTVTTSFVAQHKISSRQNEVLDTTLDISFTPVDTVQVFDAQIVHIVTGGNLFTYQQPLNRQLAARFSKGKLKETNTIWIGLKMNPRIENLQHLSFYFDWKNIEPKLAQRIYQLLPLAKWYLDGRELEIKVGTTYSTETVPIDVYENTFLEYDLLKLLEKDIKQFYNQKFITISDSHFNNIPDSKNNFPPEFKDQYYENDLQQLKEPLAWLQIVFPAQMQQEYLNDMHVYLNAFPVMNRKINDLKYRLKGGSTIIPLKTGLLDQFLSVKSLSDESYEYRPIPYRKTEEEAIGTYTLRMGGVERFDGRNAHELISYLLELLRSESAAFAAYGYDFIATTLKEMNQKISLMEHKTKGYIQNAAEVPSYIIVKPFEGKDMMYVEYWTTYAETANNLRAGTRLQQAKGVKVKHDSITLLTTTIGGKNRLRPEERLNAFRYGIMTRNRIITREDIRNFCFHELGDRIQKVTVERGYELLEHPKEAFKRTIDVILTTNEMGSLDNKEWQVLCDQLKTKLKTRSGMSNHYRIKLQTA